MRLLSSLILFLYFPLIIPLVCYAIGPVFRAIHAAPGLRKIYVFVNDLLRVSGLLFEKETHFLSTVSAGNNNIVVKTGNLNSQI